MKEKVTGHAHPRCLYFLLSNSGSFTFGGSLAAAALEETSPSSSYRDSGDGPVELSASIGYRQQILA
ncbi:hypothetical protein SLEP1_g23691 [Rubroshorea leprosula]|uniref:Uncharacterized protein n=1 Tax=Rubroshorea leprosula TaxID=152421 RepID=A0AAV5JD66_9ROSI|nr:hypothetical protein SLEP1_g23691 [Rubroshorea leprosula]